MKHDPRLLRHEEQIGELREKVPEWIKHLERPATPALIPKFGPLEGIRVVSTGVLIAQPLWGNLMSEPYTPMGSRAR
jgi:hypothetical protein